MVEVLGESTEPDDRAEKFTRYLTCPTLEVYILVSQTERLVEVYRRKNNWWRERFTAGETIHLDQLDLDLVVDEIFEGIL